MGGVGEKIMVSALTGVMSPLLGKLTNLMTGEYAKLKGARKQVELLRKELMAINMMLEKYAAMEKPDVQVKAWTKEVRELAYDIEDRIDLFTYHVDHEEPGAGTGSFTSGVKRILHENITRLKNLHYRHEFAGQIQELQVLVNEACERQKRYKLEEITCSNTHTEIDPRLPALYVEAEKLVAIDEPREEITNWLIGQKSKKTKQRRIVSIVGPGGSGKSTLANQVYQKIGGQFSCKAFVSVSQKCNMNSLLWELLSEIQSSCGIMDSDHHPASSYSNQQLIDRLRNLLTDKGYLIVIDDVWCQSDWETIQCVLPRNRLKISRVIMTTRIHSVAKFCCISDGDVVYEMKPLSEIDARKLFLTRAFDVEEKCPDQLEEIMDAILHKCDGLPLAIISIASLLCSKPRIKEEWDKVLNSIGCIHEKDPGLEVVDNILSLSYCDLPPPVKTCLLYLSIFPEDYIINRDNLIWGWIGEGFVIGKKGYTLREVGECYFNELINRSMIQPVDVGYDGKAGACRVHDIVHAFIVSRSIEENFVTILDGLDLSSRHEKIRRLSFRNKQVHAEETSKTKTMNLSHARSLYLFGSLSWMPTFLDLQVLRVLCIEGRFLKKISALDQNLQGSALENDHLENIGSLIHLRYLELSLTEVDTLPIQIGKLAFLQTLDLRRTSSRQLPEAIIQLKRLIILIGNGLILPDGFGKMEALQELSGIDGFSRCNYFVEDLKNLRQLKVLGVQFDHLENSSDSTYRTKSLIPLLSNLGEHSSLRSLFICSDNESADIDCLADSLCPPTRLLQKFEMEGSKSWLSKFPKWINPSLTELTYLKFRVDRMKEKHLQMLGGLPSLLALSINVLLTPEKGLRVCQSGFPCLTHLQFQNMDGPGLMILEGAMRKLEKLELNFNAERALSVYGGFGCGIRHLSSVKHIIIWARFKLAEYIFEPMSFQANYSRYVMMLIIDYQGNMLPNHPIVEVNML